jgi:prepilin-type N-terminal cleavage/methylation domain-containing protein
MKFPRKRRNGFTLIEVIAVLIILGILAAVVFSRNTDMEASLYSETEVIKSHIRYAQTQAMNKMDISTVSTALRWGIKCDGNSYWLFEGTAPDSQIRVLPDNAAGSTNKLSLATKKVGLSSFTVFFDGRGVPYDASNNLLTASPTITVTPQGKSSPSKTITITPLTGYIP